MRVGSAVTHPMFPGWGRGIIAAIITDPDTGTVLARVMWQSLDTDKLALHTLAHLKPFTDKP